MEYVTVDATEDSLELKDSSNVNGRKETEMHPSQERHSETEKCHRQGKRTWPEGDSNPGSLPYRASTLTAELPSHTISL